MKRKNASKSTSSPSKDAGLQSPYDELPQLITKSQDTIHAHDCVQDNKLFFQLNKVRVLYMHGYYSPTVSPPHQSVSELNETTKVTHARNHSLQQNKTPILDTLRSIQNVEVYCPDMKVQTKIKCWNNKQVTMFTISLILMLVSVPVAFSYLYSYHMEWFMIVLGIIVFTTPMIMSLLSCYHNIARVMIDDSLEIQSTAIEDFQPDIVVGYSYGGAIATLCTCMRLWTGPTLLLAPPIDRLLKHAGTNMIKLQQDVMIHIVHGERDQTAPLLHSKRLAGTSKVATLNVFDDDHSLTKSCTRENLEFWIRELLLRDQLFQRKLHAYNEKVRAEAGPEVYREPEVPGQETY
jgi:hypothetical protein